MSQFTPNQYVKDEFDTFASSGSSGTWYGTITSINCPLRKNRVQVRIFGIHDDTGNIPDSDLSWYHVKGQDSQVAGHTSTHNFLPGAQVCLEKNGDEFHVTGAIPGMSNNAPNVPDQTKGNNQQVGQYTTGQGADNIPLKMNPQVDKPLQAAQPQAAYGYAKGTAPYLNGQPSKFPAMKTLGALKMQSGSDILNLLNSMDGNQSGAVQAALQIIQRLRNGGFGTSSNIIGSAAVAAAQQFVSDYGAAPVLVINQELVALNAAYQQVKQFTAQNFQTNCTNGTAGNAITALGVADFAVDAGTMSSLQSAVSTGTVAAATFNLATTVTTFQTLYLNGVHTAVANATDLINALAAQCGSTQGALPALFGDPTTFVQMVVAYAALAQVCGMTAASIAAVGFGSFGIALNSGLNAIATLISQSGVTASGASNPAASVGMFTNMFSGNPVAMGEISGGGINPTSLLGITLKYAQKQQNQPQKPFAAIGGGMLAGGGSFALPSGVGSGSSGGGSGIVGVTSWNGQTGAVIYQGVTSFNGQTGNVTGVSSFNSRSGTVSLEQSDLEGPLFNMVTAPDANYTIPSNASNIYYAVSVGRTWTLPSANSVPGGWTIRCRGNVNISRPILLQCSGSDTVSIFGVSPASSASVSTQGVFFLYSDGVSQWYAESMQTYIYGGQSPVQGTLSSTIGPVSSSSTIYQITSVSVTPGLWLCTGSLAFAVASGTSSSATDNVLIRITTDSSGNTGSAMISPAFTNGTGANAGYLTMTCTISVTTASTIYLMARWVASSAATVQWLPTSSTGNPNTLNCYQIG